MAKAEVVAQNLKFEESLMNRIHQEEGEAAVVERFSISAVFRYYSKKMVEPEEVEYS